MWRVFTFVIVFGQTIYYFYSARHPERTVLAQILPTKSPVLRKKLLLGLGFFFLFISMILVAGTVMQRGPQN